jgi:uncharacterized protein YggE
MRLAGLLFVFAAAAAAQVGDGLVTSVSRTVTISPDQAEFLVAATSALDAAQSDVLQAFRKIGVQNLTLNTVAAAPNASQYPPPAANQLYYSISFTTAPGQLKDFAARLEELKAALPEPVTSVQYSAMLDASAAAVEAARQLALPALLAEARTKAQNLAQSAGLKIGPIQGLTESSYGVPAAVSGYFLSAAGLGSAISSSSGSGNTQYTFGAAVKFAVQ